MYRFKVPTNFDASLPERFDELNARHAGRAVIEEVYGCHATTFIGSGLQSECLPAVDDAAFAEHVRALRQRGLEFAYPLNAPCAGGREGTLQGLTEIRRRLQFLSDLGIRRVIVAMPYLIELVRECFPEFEVSLSILAGADSVPKVRMYERLGATCLTLDLAILRNFPMLRAIRRESRARLSFIVNMDCLIACPYKDYHYALVGHLSQDGWRREELAALDYVLDRCLLEYYGDRDAAQLLRCGWIRPEDLGVYQDAGIDLFKIQGRVYSTEKIVRIAGAYMQGSYDGNLRELTTQGDLPCRIAAIDNKRLDGFLDFFLEQGCRWSRGCDGCRHCETFAAKAVVVDERTRQESVAGAVQRMRDSVTRDVRLAARIHALAEKLAVG